VVKRDRKERLTALMHHVYDVEQLRQAYHGVKHDASAGIDGESWRGYGEDLEGNFRDLSERLRRGAYRARPVKRVYIPKADGRKRPIGVPALEDKIVQRAVVQVLNAVWEQEFLGMFHMEICRRWLRVLRRRSHKHNLTWERMKRLIARWIPPARICHPYPLTLFHAFTQGKSPVR
jgi:hypothetical protein